MLPYCLVRRICNSLDVSDLAAHTTLILTILSDTAWERVALTQDQKKAVWLTESGWILLDGSKGLGEPRKMVFPAGDRWAISEKNRALFLELDLFFVKVYHHL